MTTSHDLHSHSLASDGTLSPEQLVQAAHAAGVQVLALTDHDSTDGIDAASRAARQCGLQLVAGVEVSVTWQSQTVHILGLHVDPATPALQQGLAGLRAFRDWRALEIGQRLARAGIGGAYSGAQALASGNIISRTHFAQYLVEQGHADSVRTVFRRFLVHNKPGHVAGEWATLEDALGWIRTAGGIAVIAHPARYNMTASKLRRLAGEFRECGGLGMEVVSGSHTRDNISAMGALCQREGLLASSGSDYHGPQNCWIRLGELPALPPGCTPVWASEHWPLPARINPCPHPV
jgi:predicted metal-dependent phosphoesterase TrpH